MTNNVIPMTAGAQPAAATAAAPSNHMEGTKDAFLQTAMNDTVNAYVSPVTGLKGKPTAADFRDPVAAGKLAFDILDNTNVHYEMRNPFVSKVNKWAAPQFLPNHIIADLLVRTGDFARLISADGTGARLLMRVRTGPDIGIHRAIDPDQPDPELMLMISNLRPSISSRDVAEIIRRMIADIRLRSYDPQADTDNMLVWAANGIFNLHDSTFTDYSDPAFDDRYANAVSTVKLAVRYNPAAAQMPVIKTPSGDDWTFDKQLTDTFDFPGCDPAVRDASIKAIWQMLHLAVRLMSGGMAMWFTNAANGATGRNGKSTITAAVKNLLGLRSVLSTPVEDLNERFALARLPYCSAIISDETSADTKAVEKAAVYKALVTGEAVMVDEKGRTAYSYSGFHGPMIQAMNGVIKLQTVGGSLWRRILVLRFERSFDTADENPLVKAEYLRDPAVLEAILYRALHMPVIDRFSPDVVAALEPNKADVRTQSSKVWAYLDDAAPLLKAWADMRKYHKPEKPFRVPLKLLYDCYRDRNGWSVKAGFNRVLSYPQFTADFVGWIGEHSAEWKLYDKTSVTGLYSWVASSAHGVSPLLAEYPASDWADDGSANIVARGRMIVGRFPSTARGVVEYIGA